MRPLCYCPDGGSVIETCTRTIQGRFLLRPGPEANEIMLGVLGRALDHYHVELFGLCFLSNHYHLLFQADSALQMARFQGYLNSNLARKVGKHHDWSERFWARRYHSSILDDAPETQLARLKYLLANGTKEHLVSSPLDWPGPNMAKSILHNQPLVGYWFNQTKEWAAHRRGENFRRYDYATRYEIKLQPLPAFRHLPEDDYKNILLELINEIEREAEAERRGRTTVGPERIRTQDPHGAPRKPKKSVAPRLFFASSRKRLGAMKGEYQDFVKLYRLAADRLLAAQNARSQIDPQFDFPQGSFPPALQFVGDRLPSPPPQPLSRRLGYAEKKPRTIIERGMIPVIRLPRGETISPHLNPRCHSPPLIE